VGASVIGSVNEVFQNAEELATLRAENERLHQENTTLKEWQQIAIKLQEENAALRKNFNVVNDLPPSFVTARVISDTSGGFVRTLVINSGTVDNVRKGQAVLFEGNFVGRVMEVSDHAARVLLITDFSSRIPVLVADSGEQGILTGNNSNVMRLLYLSQPQAVNPGDKVITSGKGGGLPAGLAIGIVEEWDGEVMRVKPFVDLTSLRYVQVVDYGLSTLLESFAPVGGKK
jgi:rod shape-determining protein MreC